MLKFINKIFNKEQQQITEDKSDAQISVLSEEEKNEKLKELKRQGNDALIQGNLELAEKNYREAVALDANYLEARINLAWVLNSKNSSNTDIIEEAKNHLLKALEINPNNIDVNFILGQTYEKLKEVDNAISSYIITLKLKPDFDIARNALYMLSIHSKKFHIVVDFIKEELSDNPNKFQLYFDLGNFYKEIENYSEAINCYEKYLSYNDNTSQVYNNLGAVYFRAKNPEMAIKNYKKAIELGDLDLTIDSTNQLLFTMNYLPEFDLNDYHEEAKKYGKLLNQKYEQFTSWKEKGEKLKIGFVSGDLKYHPVAYFLMNLIKNIDKKKYELIAYSTSITEDGMSHELKKYFTQWNRINILDPVECARLIHEQGIDILVDLAGHSHGHFAKNLHIFSMKPAPVQVTWLGYFNSTGVKQMDYIILDDYCINKEEYQFMTEKVMNLPETRLNYYPPEDNVKQQTEIPAIKNGYITFGCYQSLLKINEEVLSVWSEILNKVPNSKIRIQEKSLKNEFVKNEFLQELKKHNLENKVILVEGISHQDYLNSYFEVDMILDTFPFTGGTTTCEALWMGVPTLTLNGKTIIGRQSASFLKELKMTEWIAEDKNQYIQKAVNLSQDLEKLNDIRKNLRKEFLDSSICDGKNFALDFEELLEEMWSKSKSV